MTLNLSQCKQQFMNNPQAFLTLRAVVATMKKTLLQQRVTGKRAHCSSATRLSKCSKTKEQKFGHLLNTKRSRYQIMLRVQNKVTLRIKQKEVAI